MKYAETIVDLVGNTPLVKLQPRHRGGDGATVLVKLEYFNPGGSAKDRIAGRIIDAAEREGKLKPGGTIVEPTSRQHRRGARARRPAARLQVRLRRAPTRSAKTSATCSRAYGAEVVVTPTAVAPDSPESYYSVSDRLAREIPGAFKPNQYANPNGPRSHYETTGPEIWRDTDGHGHALRRGRRHRRHDHRHRPLPARGVGRRGAHHRRRPRGLGLLGRHRAPLPRRGRRRGLLARGIRPRRVARDHRASPTPSRSR